MNLDKAITLGDLIAVTGFVIGGYMLYWSISGIIRDHQENKRIKR